MLNCQLTRYEKKKKNCHHLNNKFTKRISKHSSSWGFDLTVKKGQEMTLVVAI